MTHRAVRKKKILLLIHRLQDIAQLRGGSESTQEIGSDGKGRKLKFESPLWTILWGDLGGAHVRLLTPYVDAFLQCNDSDCWIAREGRRRVIFSMSQTLETFSKTIKNLPTCSPHIPKHPYYMYWNCLRFRTRLKFVVFSLTSNFFPRRNIQGYIWQNIFSGSDMLTKFSISRLSHENMMPKWMILKFFDLLKPNSSGDWK